MKGKLAIVISIALVFTLGLVSSAYAQAIDMKDIKALCEEGYANAKPTKDIVADIIVDVGKETTADSSDLKKGELEDAKMWFEKADKLLKSCKTKMDKGQYTKEISLDLNQSWQWFIKSGSAAVRTGMQE